MVGREGHWRGMGVEGLIVLMLLILKGVGRMRLLLMHWDRAVVNHPNGTAHWVGESEEKKLNIKVKKEQSVF